MTNYQNPFAGFNASLLNDEEIIDLIIPPRGIDLFVGKIPAVLMGGRGTGKTMLLKYLSHEIQSEKFFAENNGSYSGFLESCKYLSVYYRFDGPNISTFSYSGISKDISVTLFKHYFEIIIAQKYIEMISLFQKKGIINIDEDCQKKLNGEIFNLIFNRNNELDASLNSIAEALQFLVDEVFDYVTIVTLDKDYKFSPSAIIPAGKLTFGLPKIFTKYMDALEEKNFIILLDEYENLSKDQQKCINTLIKHAKSRVSFKIGCRHYGFKTYDTLNSGEFLLEDADYRQVIVEDKLLESKKNYRGLLKEIAKKRLESNPTFKNNVLDLEELLENITPVEEARLVAFGDKQGTRVGAKGSVKHIQLIEKELKNKGIPREDILKYIELLTDEINPLFDMLHLVLLRRGYPPSEIFTLYTTYKEDKKGLQNSAYHDLYEKNELNLLFQLVSINKPKQKIYAGFNTLSTLSSGIIRNFIELCYQSFNIAGFIESDEFLRSNKISINSQREGTEIRSEKFYQSIERIPDLGIKIQSFVRSIAAIFYAWHMDPRLREPETTYFSTDVSLLSPQALEIIQTAVQWSVLQKKKQMKSKNPDEPRLDVFALNPILSPYFSISYRVRGRLPSFSAEDIHSLLSNNEQLINKTVRRLSRVDQFLTPQLDLFSSSSQEND